MRREDADRVVAEIDETRRAEHWRDPDRPDPRVFAPRRVRVPPEIVKAQTRLRTAAWRNRMDRRRAPTGREVGMALVAALITSSMSEIMESSDRGILAKALVDLDRRGFSVTEAKATLRRLRDRHVEHDDRKGDGGLPF
ncbi:hypothetical protein ACVWZK_002942 [Bradyrhizobium sp. GM0.4]